MISIDKTAAALYFHHGWPTKAADPGRFAAQPYDARGHVLAGVEGAQAGVAAVHARAVEVLTASALRDVVDLVPAEWLEPARSAATPELVRSAYLEHLTARLANPAAWLPAGGGAV